MFAYSVKIFLVHTKEKYSQMFWCVERISMSLFEPTPVQVAVKRLSYRMSINKKEKGV